MDDRCKKVPNVPTNKLMPLFDRSNGLIQNPGELGGKLPKDMPAIMKKVKATLSKSGNLNYCKDADRQILMQNLQNGVMQYAFPVKMTWDKQCDNYAKWAEGPAGVAFGKEMSDLIVKSMA